MWGFRETTQDRARTIVPWLLYEHRKNEGSNVESYAERVTIEGQ